MYKRVLVLAATSVLMLAGPLASVAFAGGTGDGWTDGNGVGANASTPGGPATVDVTKSRGGGAPVCSYEALTPEESTMADNMAADGLGPAKGSGAGIWYRKMCTDPNGMRWAIVVWAPAAAPVNPTALAQQALGYTPMPLPGMGMNPPANREQLVNLTTFLWIDQAQWRPVSASASAGGVTVVATAVPDRVVWDMGNGESVTCNGPGVPYDPSKSDDDQPDPCRYLYRRSSAGQPKNTFTVTATVSWRVTWTASGVAAGQPAAGSLGVVTRSSSVPVRVAEAEATNTNR